MTTRPGRTLALAAMLLAACGRAWAEEDVELRELTKPDSLAALGIGYLTDDGRRFGMYTGVNDRGPYALADVKLNWRDDATGTWLTLNGRSLGLDSRELRFEHNRQGDWGYFTEFSQTPRFEPYTVNTRLLGIDTDTQTVNGRATARDFDLDTRRMMVGVGIDKVLPLGFDVQVRFRNEEKDGSRLFGQGFFGPMNFLAEPINYTTRQFEATLGYASDRFQLSGGYYGTDFSNHTTALNVVGGVAGLTPIALPPGNQSHQLFLSGGYSFTPTTRGTFKVAYAWQTQTEDFVVPSIVGRTDLAGRVDTTLLQGAVTSRPLPKLLLLASLRYEDRDDRTPVAQYLTAGIVGASTTDGRNEPNSIRALTGKMEASYALPAAVSLTESIEYDRRDRNTFRVRSVSHRDTTEEWAFRTELRRAVSETVTGALSYTYADRNGSDFLTTVLNNGTTGSNLIHPLRLADRERNKVRLTLNWQPTEPLSVQFYADYAHDKYGGRLLGPRKGEAQVYSLDATYALSEQWHVSAWISRNVVSADQSTCVGASAAGVCPGTAASPFWNANLRDVSDAVGVALRGKPHSALEVGGEVLHSRDRSEYRLSSTTPGALVTSLPDVRFDVTRVNLFAAHALRKNIGVRVNYTFERWNMDDWTWTTWTYTDGTRVLQEPTQNVHFIGVSMTYGFQ